MTVAVEPAKDPGAKGDPVPAKEEAMPELKPQTFVEYWLIKPKIIYFMLNMFVYALHGVMGIVMFEELHLSYVWVAIFSAINVFNFVGSFYWPPLADKTGKYKGIISITAIGYTIVGCIIAYSKFGKAYNEGWRLAFKYSYYIALLAILNFILSAPFPLVDSLVMGMLSADPRYNRNQLGKQRMFGSFGHFAATLIVFKFKEYAKMWDYLADLKKKDGLNPLNPLGLLTSNGIDDAKLYDYNSASQQIKSVLRHYNFEFEKVPDNALMKFKGVAKTIQWENVFIAFPNTEHREPPVLCLCQLFITCLFVLVVWFLVPNVKPVKAGHGHHGHSSKKTKNVDVKDDGNHQEEEVDTRHPAIRLASNPSFVFFMIFVLCCGIIRSIMTTFQKPIAKEVFGGDLWQTAKSEGTRVLSEVAIYVAAPTLKQWFGNYWGLVLSQLVGIVRQLGYAFVNCTPSRIKPQFGSFTEFDVMLYFVYFLELLKGFSSGLISSSAIAIANEIAPPGTEATAQGLYSSNYTGASTVVAGLTSAALLRLFWGYGTRDSALTLDSKGDYKNISDEDAKKYYGPDKLYTTNTLTPFETRGIQNMILVETIACFVVTVLMMGKFIFVDRVMGIPGFPRRRHSLAN